MLPTPGTGEILLIVLLVAIVFFGEKVGAIGDAIGRARDRGRSDAAPPSPPAAKADEPR